MVIDNNILSLLQSGNGGYTKEFAKVLGIPFPYKRGWKKDLVNKKIPLTNDLLGRLILANKKKATSGQKKKNKKKSKPQKIRWTKEKYKSFLKSKYWQNIKDESKFMPRFHRCKACGTDKNLHLHHIHYNFLKTEREFEALVSLCAKHHEDVHKYQKDNGCTIEFATKTIINRNK